MEYSSFDHIVIPFNENKTNKKIYMVSYSKQLILEVTVESANYRNLMNELYSKSRVCRYTTSIRSEKAKNFSCRMRGLI